MTISIVRAFGDTFTLVGRTLRRYQRSPSSIVILIIQPLVILLVFRYILGGQVRYPDYVQYLIPGILALTAINGSATVGLGLADDVNTGVIDRFRARPIARPAFLTARAVTDIERNLVIMPLVGALGVVVGFTFVGSPPRAILAFTLLLMLGSVFAWISMAIALWTRSFEATQGAAYILTLVFSFTSSGFAYVSTMPSWLQQLVKLNPVTHVDDAVRTLITTAHGGAAHDVVISIVSLGAILVITVPLAVLRYTRFAK